MHHVLRIVSHWLWHLAIFMVRLVSWCIVAGWLFYVAVILFLKDPTEEEKQLQELG